MFTLFLQPTAQSHPCFYTHFSILCSIHLNQEWCMDMVFLAAAGALWGVMVLLVWGFEKLEVPAGGRP